MLLLFRSLSRTLDLPVEGTPLTFGLPPPYKA